MLDYVMEWGSLLLRWLHVITAIAWIGSSFYFVWLDLSLRKRDGMPKGAHGESWSVHGGGFYHVQKYLVAPERMPEELHWFKHESYFTWLSGFALLMVVYWYGAQSYLIDPAVADISVSWAIAISALSLVGGWIFFDQLCKSKLGENLWVLGGIIFGFLMLAGWAYSEVFSGRAALLHVGAMIATWMTGNVFFIIIPNQKKVVATLQAGGTPDAIYGKIAKQRSTFNNYLTLPVLFMMLSNHYPMTFAVEQLWVVVGLIVLIGASIRCWFNFGHEGRSGLAMQWQWPTAGVLTLMLAWFVYVPPIQAEVGETVISDAQALAITQQHCVACHGSVKAAAMKGVQLHDVPSIVQNKSGVLAQAVVGRAMPMGNASGMTDLERRQLGLWLQSR
mgnify:FL=1